MQLFCSYSWLKRLTHTRKTPEQIAALLSEHGPTVDRMANWSARFDHMVVGEIVSVSAHPNAEKLRLVQTDIGEKRVQIVCGGSNLEAGQHVVVALPGARVRWHGEGDYVTLSETAIRGEKSFGMICGANEIDLATWFPHDEREIMDVTAYAAKSGTPLARALSLDDVVFDVDVTSNRPDMMSMEGIARELMAIEGKTFDVPATSAIVAGDETLSVDVRDSALCSRYQAVKIDGVRVQSSPLWMQSALYKAGIKPINNIVDISNYVMLEQGQPLHAFDGEKVEQIVVRRAHEQENFVALNGQTYVLDDSMLVIADAQKAVAVAGVMGGAESAISSLTNAVVWESAHFDPVHVRQTSRKLLLFSEAQSRFDKGLSSFATQRALERAVELTLELAGGTVATRVVDRVATSYKPIAYDFNPADIARVCGFDISLDDARQSLERLGFTVSGSKTWHVTVPYWRDHDIESSRDLIEEIARMYGYARVAGTIPSGVSSVPTDPLFSTARRVGDYLVGKGFFEMISYSMIGREDIEKLEDDVDEYVCLANPLSADAECMRVSMLSSALHAVARNESLAPQGRLFEIASLYDKREDDIPEETPYVMCVMWDTSPQRPLFYDVKGVLSELCDVEYESAEFDNVHPGRSALLSVGERELGVLGEVHPHTLKQFGVEARVAVCQLDLRVLSEAFSQRGSFQSIPDFPGVKRDIAFFIDAHTLYDDVISALTNAHELVADVSLFDVYVGAGVQEGKKSMAFHIEYRDRHKTLSMEEADAAHAAVEKALKSLGGEVRK